MADLTVQYYKKLYIDNSKINGIGLFAGEDIKVNEKVLSFGGTFALLAERDSGKYISSTFVGISENIILCEEKSSQKDYSDYINHSCDPNVGMSDSITIIAIKDIKKGDEIVCDYAFWEADENWILKRQCNCGSENCRKYVSGKDWMKVKSDDSYFQYYSPFLQRRIKKMNKNLNILVTGASRGIGNAIVNKIAHRTSNLLVTSKYENSLNIGISKLKKEFKGNIYQLNIDQSVGENEAVKVSKWAANKVPYLDALILCAGDFIEGDLCSTTSEELSATMNTNFYFNIYVVNKLLPLLKAAKNSKIIIIGSTAAYSSYSVPTYSVAKWALRGYATNLRKELMGDRIGVTFISPGGTLTDMWADVEVPENRLLEPDDIAKLIDNLFELSEQAVVEELVIRPMLGDFDE